MIKTGTVTLEIEYDDEATGAPEVWDWAVLIGGEHVAHLSDRIIIRDASAATDEG